MTTTLELQGQLVVQLETELETTLETKLKLGPGCSIDHHVLAALWLEQAAALLDEPACGHLFVGPVGYVPLAQALASLADLCLVLAEQDTSQKKVDDATAVVGETSREVHAADTALGVDSTARWVSFAHSGENVQPGVVGVGAPIGPEVLVHCPQSWVCFLCCGWECGSADASWTPTFLDPWAIIVHASTDVGELYWVKTLAVVLQGPVGVPLGSVSVG